jgi:hypothetical protein
MRMFRMTTRQWMILVAVVSPAFALLVFLRRLAANKVAGFMQHVRDQAGLPPDASLSDFNVPVTRDVANWIDIDNLLSRFWIVLLTLIVLATWVTVAYFPRGRSQSKHSTQ